MHLAPKGCQGNASFNSGARVYWALSAVICFLRGVNVTGTHVIKMEDLRSLCEATGLLNIKTYLYSGNVVLGR